MSKFTELYNKLQSMCDENGYVLDDYVIKNGVYVVDYFVFCQDKILVCPVSGSSEFIYDYEINNNEESFKFFVPMES